MTNRWKEQYDVDASEAVEYLTSEYNEFEGYDELEREVTSIEAGFRSSYRGIFGGGGSCATR